MGVNDWLITGDGLDLQILNMWTCAYEEKCDSVLHKRILFYKDTELPPMATLASETLPRGNKKKPAIKYLPIEYCVWALV